MIPLYENFYQRKKKKQTNKQTPDMNLCLYKSIINIDPCFDYFFNLANIYLYQL